LRRLFRQIDSNESGDIDQAEMSELIHTCTGHKPTDAEAAAMLAKADANGDGRIDFEEFVLLHAHIRNGAWFFGFRGVPAHDGYSQWLNEDTQPLVLM
jgi:hypothetical protein